MKALYGRQLSEKRIERLSWTCHVDLKNKIRGEFVALLRDRTLDREILLAASSAILNFGTLFTAWITKRVWEWDWYGSRKEGIKRYAGHALVFINTIWRVLGQSVFRVEWHVAEWKGTVSENDDELDRFFYAFFFFDNDEIVI